jgi:hypothetical protein
VAIRAAFQEREELRRAAHRDAAYRLQRAVRGVRLYGRTTVGQQMDASDSLREVIERRAERFQVLEDTLHEEETTFESRVVLSFGGENGLLAALLPPDTTAEESAPTTGSATGGYSGIVVEARRLGLRLALLPVLLDASGDTLLEPRGMDRDSLLQRGGIPYARSLDHPMVKRTAGANPLVLHAAEAGGPSRTNPVLDAASMSRLRESADLQSLLRACRFLILAD